MLTKDDYAEIKKELDTSYHPLYFYDDDTDGLASFLLFYRYVREGKGIILKTSPNVDMKFLHKVQDYHPDKIFILDLAKAEQEFIDKTKTPIVWIDHHGPVERNKVKYFNPIVKEPKKNLPTAYSCYKVVEQDIWIAMIGIVGDWTLPADVQKKFSEKYPDLLPPSVTNPGKAMFDTKLGKLVQIYEFCLKGKTSEVKKLVKILTRINDPYEILEGKTPRSKLILKHYKKIKKEFDSLMKGVKPDKDSPMIVYHYHSGRMSLSGEISNHVLYKYPDKFIIILREKNGEMKCSFRSHTFNVKKILAKALIGVDGTGGGHIEACGGVIKKYDWDKFLENIKAQL
tara:strand:+ start:13247 stop:14272 length:1026 start_codon:yes stop_codon:yes gene_type:complete